MTGAAAVAALLLWTVPAAAQTDTPDPATRTAVLAPAFAVLQGITNRDVELIRANVLPDIRMQGLTAPGTPYREGPAQQLESFLPSLERDGPAYVERMWDPVVRVRGRIADVWAPYDFYAEGELSHCGVDVFQLVETEAGWKVASVVWTVEQPPACELHPDGPPGG